MLALAPRWSSIVLGLLVGVLACDWPRDPEGTLKRVRGGTLRVGAVHQPPWVILDPEGGPPGGSEAELTAELARRLDAELEWRTGGETQLMQALQKFELDLVIGGITTESPYREEVGFTAPYHKEPDGEHVFAAPPGENGWVATLERFLGEQEAAP